MANSIAATRITGSEMERSVSRMITATIPMETESTVMKSLFVILIRSRVQGASPTSMALSSYFLMISSILSHCLFTSSVAAWYSLMIIIISQSPSSNISRRLEGSSSFGTSAPSSASSPRTVLTPSTSLISSDMFTTCFASISLL